MSTQTRRTLSQLRTSLRQRVPVSDSDTQVTYAVLDEFINAALRQVSVEHDWPWLLKSVSAVTVAGTETVATPADWLGTKLILVSTTADVVRQRHLEEVLSIPTTTRGQPEVFAIDQELIRLRPVPDAVYTLTHYYYKTEPVLVGDTAQPLIPQGYDEGVIEYAAYLTHRFKRNDERALSALKSYSAWLGRSRDNLVEGKNPRPPKTRPGSLL